jgi:hypothetical protein
VFVKKDIPAREGAGYRSPIEIRAAKEPIKSTGTSWKHARGQKQIAPALEKGMQFRATVCIRRHNRAARANTGGGCFDFRASIFRACTLFP